MAAQPLNPPRTYNNGFLPNGAPPPAPVPGAAPLLPNQGRVLQAGPTRILCVADVRGNLKSLNDLAKSARADYIIHTGDFGFYDERSLDRIAEKTLKHVAQYSPLISDDVRRSVNDPRSTQSIKERFGPQQLPLSQLPLFLTGQYSFDVPVYTVWGACEDVQVLEKLRSGEYKIDKLHIIDEAHSRLIEVGGVKLRLLGLGGAVVMHKLFDNGEGRTTIAGGQGTMWTTLLQMGELVDTANRVYDPSETRVLVTHASPAREGLLNQLSVNLKVDFSISAGLHFRYGSSYNEFSVNPTLDHYRGKLAASKASFNDVWETVKGEVEPAVQENEAQKRLLYNAIEVVNKMPSVANGGNPFGGHTGPSSGQVDEVAFKNMWNFNLADAAFGWLVLEVEGGRIGTEMKAQGFNFAHRGMKNPPPSTDAVKPAAISPAAGPSPAPGPQAVQPPAQVRSQVPGGPGGPGGPAAPQARQVPPARSQPAAQAPSATPAAPQGKVTQAPANVAAVASAEAASTTAVTAANGTAEAKELAAPEAKANGTATAVEDMSKGTPPPAEKKASTGLFVTRVNTEDEAKNLLPETDRSKIQRVERQGKAFVLHFASPEEAQTVLKALPDSVKKGAGPGEPNVREYVERGARSFSQGQRWENNRPGGGYRSGGASDSEGGRGGRGGFRGRGRGGERGGRGGRGRGSFRGGQGEGSAAPAPAPTAAS